MFDPRTDKDWHNGLAWISNPRREPVEHALSYLGLIENPIGSNDEPTGVIDGWLKAARAPDGQPWCAAALSSWLGLSPRYASAQALGHAFPATRAPLVGDIMWYPTGEWQGHCGLVIGIADLGRGLFDTMTIEGNSNNAVRVWRRRGTACQFSVSPIKGRDRALLPIPSHCPYTPTNATSR